ncbi:MAG TPA: HNH endonuclease, partial [Micromonosporaceae bacterium]|nr:HNH endonuclease [Micromonosporaceae bacterium]
DGGGSDTQTVNAPAVDAQVVDAQTVDALTDVLAVRARAAAVADAALLDAVVAVADRDRLGFDADQVAVTLAWTRAAARYQVEFGRYLQRVVKPVWAAMCAGDVDVPRARVFHDVLCAVDDGVAFTIALDHVDRAPGWTTGQLRDRLRRAVLRADPHGAAERTARTVGQRRVELLADRESTAGLYALCLPAVRAVAAFERVDAIARARHSAADGRTLDQLRADTLLDLLEGVGIGVSPVHRRGVVELTIPWSTLAGGRASTAAQPEPMPELDDGGITASPGEPAAGCSAGRGVGEPATLAGFGPIEASTARDVAMSMLGRRDIAWRYRVTDDNGALRALGTLSTPKHTDALGQLIDQVPVTPATPPAEANPRRRMPGPALARWIRARDGTCRAPGCRVPASRCDIDHTIDHASGGGTTHDNLALLCRHHHRLKHDGGWHVTQPEPGVLAWQSPHGTRFTRQRD